VEAEKTVVVGGGVVGLCCALALQRRGIDTLVIDPAHSPPPASFGNAGHIAIEQAEPLASPATLRSMPRRLALFGGPVSLPPRHADQWLPFALRLVRAARPDRFAAGRAALGSLLAQAMPAWRRLADSLDPGGLLIEDGHAVVWHDGAAALRGLKAWQGTDIGNARFHAASRDELAWLATAMRTPPAGAVVFENTGQVADPAMVLAALDDAFRQAGGARRTGLARGLAVRDGRAELVLADGSRLRPPRLVVAAGVDSGALMATLGIAAPIIAERGYHIQAAAHAWPAGMPPVVFEERSIIVTRFDSGLRAAGFVEFGRNDAPPDAGKWRRLERHAADVGLPATGPWSRWVGARPTLPDYLPAIGRVPQARNLAYAFGHQHLGLTLAPLTAEMIAAMLADERPSVAAAPFDLGRFA